MQTPTLKTTTTVWALALLASAFVLAASVVGPRPAFATLCHQLSARSFIADGHLFAVCHRCTGIYTGIFFGLLIVALPNVRSFVSNFGLALVAGAATLVTLDAGLDLLGILSNTAATRVSTGFLLGLAGGAFLGATICPPIGTRYHYNHRSPLEFDEPASEYRIPNTEYRIPNNE